jgi:hypothetical protein
MEMPPSASITGLLRLERMASLFEASRPKGP